MDAGERREALMTALGGTSPGRPLPVRTVLAPLPSGEDRVWLGVVVGAPAHFLATDASGAGKIQVVVEVKDRLGASVTHFHHEVVLEPDQRLEAAREHGLEFVGGIELPRGRGSLRLRRCRRGGRRMV